MTNFEHMKEKILEVVSVMDEAELIQLISDTCMEDDVKGIWCCTLCEEHYGDCPTWLGSKVCQNRCLSWCSMEHASNSNAKAVEETRGALEDKKDIVKRLSILLKATRIGSDISELILSEDENIITIKCINAKEKYVNVECDSGLAIIKDVIAALC